MLALAYGKCKCFSLLGRLECFFFSSIDLPWNLHTFFTRHPTIRRNEYDRRFQEPFPIQAHSQDFAQVGEWGNDMLSGSVATRKL